MPTFKIALVQMMVTADKATNLRAAAGHIARCADAGADVIMLPEMFCCPYQAATFPQYAEQAGGPTWTMLSETARRNQVILAGGSFPECDAAGHIYNSCFVFGRNGEQLALHRKMHLFDIDVVGGQRFRESETLSPGNEVTVFDTAFGKMGVIICYDLRFPELSRLVALQGAQVLLVPGAFNMTTGPAHWEVLFRTRALDNQVFTAGCAPARDTSASYVSYGHSILVSPWGNVLGQLEHEEGILFAEIDLNLVERVRRELPLLSHRRIDLYEVRKLR